MQMTGINVSSTFACKFRLEVASEPPIGCAGIFPYDTESDSWCLLVPACSIESTAVLVGLRALQLGTFLHRLMSRPLK